MKLFMTGLLALALVAGVLAQDDDPFAGTWKLNVEKSKLVKPLARATMTIRGAIDEVDIRMSMEKMTLETVDAKGVRESLGYTGRYQGPSDYRLMNLITGMPTG